LSPLISLAFAYHNLRTGGIVRQFNLNETLER
jgi:hypothetical protein